ncbi:MAG TPA: head-tail connector protein [Allosphingosinicella sp.]|jgi:uncharacterized phiE125 gp8 family phage protein
MAEPVSLDDVRAYLRIDSDKTDEDAFLAAAITAARRGCEKYLNRSVIGETRTAVFSGFPLWPTYLSGQLPTREQLVLYLAGGVVQSVQSVTYVDGDGSTQTVDPESYILDLWSMPARLAPLDAWPIAADRPEAVRVAYTVASLGDDDMSAVAQAIRMLVANWYVNREAAVVDVRGVPAELPQSVRWLIDGLRIRPFR